MDFTIGLEQLKSNLNKNISHDALILKNAFDNVKGDLIKYVSDSAGAYKYLQAYSSERDIPNRGNEPEGFIYGIEKIPSINPQENILFPLIHPFKKVGATAIEENSNCASFFFNFVLRSIISYPLGDSIVYMIDSNVSGDFNLLSPICTELGDADSEKNMFHYITTDEDANKMLQELTEVMDRNIRNHVSKYPDLCSYNKDNPNMYEPYHFVFIKDITETLRDKRQIDKLTRLVQSQNATKAGIYIFYTYNKSILTNNENTYFSDICGAIQNLLSISYVTESPTRHYVDAELSLEPKASYEIVNKVIDYVQTQKPPMTIMSFKDKIQQMLAKGDLWHPSFKRQPSHLYFPVGFQDAVTPKEIDVQFVGDKTPHLLIGGAAGSGKSILLQNFILNGALRYSPDELQFYLADMKGGVSFVHYKQLPHVAALCASSDCHYVESLLDLFCHEIEKRTSLFKKAGVQKLEEYNEIARNSNKQILPYLFGIVDEFQVLFPDSGNAISSKAKGHIKNIHTMGRSQGVFIALCSQEPPDINLSQVGYKISLSCVKSSSNKILGNEGASKLRGIGRAILNTDKACEEKSNQIFQVAYIDEQKELPIYVEQIRKIYLKQNKGVDKYDHLIYDDNDQSAKISENPIIMYPESVNQDYAPYIYIGIPGFYRKEHVKFCFHRDSKSNVVICGTDRPSALRLVGIITIQFLRFYKKQGAKVYICDLQKQTEGTYNKLEFLSMKQEVSHFGLANLKNTIDELYQILNQRKDNAANSVHDPEILFSILDIKSDVFPSTQTNDYFSFDGTNEKSLLVKFKELIEEGPNYGIHIMIYGYNYDNLSFLQQISSSLDMMEIKIALRGGDSSKIIRNINAPEIVDQYGKGYIYMPEEMGLKYNDGDSYGDPFLIYNLIGDKKFENSVWDKLFKLLPNKDY